MMFANPELSVKKLSEITDSGFFELLATAILREAEPICAATVHTGVNVEGKTIKAPMDGICFVPGADPPLSGDNSNCRSTPFLST